jgi:hypothetical protein
MRKTMLGGLVAVLLIAISVPVMAGNVVKEEKAWPCDVNWTSGDLLLVDCEIENIEYDNGGFTIDLHGQVPPERLAAFKASGVTDFATKCWVNYLFVDQDGQIPVTVSSVRHFTSDGAMTEHCHGVFSDTHDNLFERGIEWMAFEGITKGCNPPVNDRYCPNSSVTRGQMAAFLVRALDLPHAASAGFTDTVGSVFANDIDRLAAAGITKGCNPPTNNRYCPDSRVTRGQMAAFLVRALGYTDNGGGDLFIDDDDSIFEGDIDRLGTAGVTKGCNPAEGNTKYCPDSYVTRGQMAAFLNRALG